MSVFEELEQLNCQVDIWIDEEDYEQVFAAIEANRLWRKRLAVAFEHPTCTSVKEQEWFDLLNDGDLLPIKAVRINSHDRIELDDKRNWSFFFGAKLIRAKIQQKGSDCYFQRLDEIIAYLERNIPILYKENEHTGDSSTRLAVIYLLEMAAAGVGADQISFSMRTRRILTNLINRKDDDFIGFYDLLSRFNIGIGYFHETQYRKAVLEFNHIIYEFQTKSKAAPPLNGKKKFNRKNDCFGKLLLYLPSILYRAQIQLKLQLAYHSHKTTSSFNNEFNDAGGYKKARIALIRAEAYQQMGTLEKSLEELCEATNYLLDKSSSCLIDSAQLDFQTLASRLKDTSCDQYANLRGRLIDLVIARQLTNIEKPCNIIALGDPESPYTLFKLYYDSAKGRRSVRGGYLQQLAKFLKILVDAGLINLASIVYSENRDGIIEDERETRSCLCEENGIDLRRLGPEHFEEFTNCIKKYFQGIKYISWQDSKIFYERLHWLEEEARENLNWRKKELDKIYSDLAPCNWCTTCLSAFSSSSFSGLLTCSGEQASAGTNALSDNDYEWIMDHWDIHFLDHLKKSSIQTPDNNSLHFLGLQRWNSTSPAQGQSLGGGYLVYHTDKRGVVDLGVAIDPGFDFVRNLFHVGFSLADIDIVLLSHAHLDHIRDFESMITLCLELYKRDKDKIKYKLHTIMTLGVYRRLEHIIESPGLREFIEPYIIDIDKEILEDYLPDTEFCFKLDPSSSSNVSREGCEVSAKKTNRIEAVLENLTVGDEKASVRIRPTRAYHNDYSEYSDSFGFIISFIENHKDTSSHNCPIIYSMGYTGDTKWDRDVMNQYEQCDSIIVHLGSLIDRKKEMQKKFNFYSTSEKCFNFVKDKNHPYLMGMLHFLTELKTKCEKKEKKLLVFISEFGEEMRGRIRLDLIKRLKDAYGHDIEILPVDVGLDVLLRSSRDEIGPRVLCVQCHDYIQLNHADFETYGHDEALFCVCETCRKSTPQNVLQDNLRRLYEEGKSLRTLT